MKRRDFVAGLAGLGITAQQETRSVTDIARQLTDEGGRLVVAEAGASRLRAPLPTVARLQSDADIEEALERLVKSLPDGAAWAKFWLPPPPAGKRWSGDDVAAFAAGLARLFGVVGAVNDGQTEVLGQRLPTERATGAIETLNLKPVYLISFRPRRTFVGRWNATFGELVLAVSGSRVTGTYPTNDGSISGTLRGNRVDFTWYERATNTRGRGWWVLADDGQSFDGLWGNGDESPSRPWTGTRLDGGQR